MSLVGDRNATKAAADMIAGLGLGLLTSLGVSGGESVAVGAMQAKDAAAAGLELNGKGGLALTLKLRGSRRNGEGMTTSVLFTFLSTM
jgi:hypothetical protein